MRFSPVSVDSFATFRATGLRNVALRDSRFHSDDFIVDVVLRSDQSLLYALDDLLSLNLILQVVLEDEFAVALAIQFEVGDLFHVLLINDAQLARYSVILALVNVQYVGGLPVRVTFVLW